MVTLFLLFSKEYSSFQKNDISSDKKFNFSYKLSVLLYKVCATSSFTVVRKCIMISQKDNELGVYMLKN